MELIADLSIEQQQLITGGALRGLEIFGKPVLVPGGLIKNETTIEQAAIWLKKKRQEFIEYTQEELENEIFVQSQIFVP